MYAVVLTLIVYSFLRWYIIEVYTLIYKSQRLQTQITKLNLTCIKSCKFIFLSVTKIPHTMDTYKSPSVIRLGLVESQR